MKAKTAVEAYAQAFAWRNKPMRMLRPGRHEACVVVAFALLIACGQPAPPVTTNSFVTAQSHDRASQVKFGGDIYITTNPTGTIVTYDAVNG